MSTSVTATAAHGELDIVTDMGALAPLAGEWNDLVERSGASVYQTFEWTSAWWEHLGARPGRELQVLLVRDQGAIKGIAPMYRQTDSVAGIAARRRLSLVGSGAAFAASSGLFLDDGPGDYLDIIADRQEAPLVADRIARYLAHEARSDDEAEFLNLAPGGFCREALVPALEAAGIPVRLSEADACPRITLNGSVAEFLKGRESGARRRFTQAITAAREGTLFTVRAATTEAEAISGLGELMRLHQRRWRKLGYPGLFADAGFRAFQESVARAFFRNGWLRVTRADAGGQCVAVRLSYAHNGRLYDYLSGFDDGSPAAKRRPGLALLFAQMDAALAEGIRTIDLLRGDEAYKFELTDEAPRNMNLVATLPHAAQGSVLRRAGERTALARFLARREARLFGVALGEHAFPASIYHYARFRTGRFFRKFFGPGAPSAQQPPR